jgi:hypothetical protein
MEYAPLILATIEHDADRRFLEQRRDEVSR